MGDGGDAARVEPRSPQAGSGPDSQPADRGDPGAGGGAAYGSLWIKVQGFVDDRTYRAIEQRTARDGLAGCGGGADDGSTVQETRVTAVVGTNRRGVLGRAVRSRLVLKRSPHRVAVRYASAMERVGLAHADEDLGVRVADALFAFHAPYVSERFAAADLAAATDMGLGCSAHGDVVARHGMVGSLMPVRLFGRTSRPRPPCRRGGGRRSPRGCSRMRAARDGRAPRAVSGGSRRRCSRDG